MRPAVFARTAVLVPVAALGLVAGCTGSGGTPAAAPVNAGSASAIAGGASAQPDVEPTPSLPAGRPPTSGSDTHVWKFGEVWNGLDAAGKVISAVTVLGYRQPVAQAAPVPGGQPGFGWGATLIRVCADRGAPADFSVGGPEWALAYQDGSRQRLSNVTYQDFPSPQYPTEAVPVRAGECVQGWLTFPVPKAKRPEFVEYAPARANGKVTVQRRWDVPAA